MATHRGCSPRNRFTAGRLRRARLVSALNRRGRVIKSLQALSTTDHKDHAPMVGTLAEDRSPPDESTSAPPLAPAIGEDGTTKSEAVPVNPTMSGATTPAAQSASRAQLDAKGVSSASVTLGSPGNIGDIAANRKSVECDSVALDSSPATTPAALPPRVAFGTTLAGVLSRAKAAIEAGESPRITAERLAYAYEDFHASQRKIGRAIGWSAGKVSRVLKWRRSGYREASPFGPTTRAGRASRRKHRNGSVGGGGAKQPDDDDGKAHSVGHRLPPDQPAPPPKSVKETLPSGSRQADVVSSAKAATKETKAPQAQTAPTREQPHSERARNGSRQLEPPVCKRSRGGNRQREKEQRPARNAKAGRKPSLASMLVFLDALRECPIVSIAARKAGIHRKTPAHWIKRSKAGHAGYEIEWRGEKWGFHDHYETAINEPHDLVEFHMWQIARGVRYKIDPALVELGHQGFDAYAMDEDGNFIEEVVGPPDSKMSRFLLEWKLPEKYGKHRKSDIPRTGGVGKRREQPKSNCTASIKARQWKSLSRKVRGPKA